MRRTTLGVSVLLVILASVLLFAQSATFAVLSYGPTGEINQLQDANEIRVIFSEPMVALGRIPSNPTPPWIHITPAIRGTYRWSGTTILIFTPDPTTPLPYATRYTVTVDAIGHERRGHQLGGAAAVHVHDADRQADVGAMGPAGRSLRRAGRARSSIQSARAPADVRRAPRGAVRSRTTWTAPSFTPAERARLTRPIRQACSSSTPKSRRPARPRARRDARGRARRDRLGSDAIPAVGRRRSSSRRRRRRRRAAGCS